MLNGKTNLEKVWGQCIGCPTGPDATARDIVQYIARGQIKTLACYDALPSLNFGQIQKMADWYEKTQKFQRAVYCRRRQPRGQGQRLLQRAGQALRIRAERRRHRHRCRQRVAVHRRPRAVGREEEESRVELSLGSWIDPAHDLGSIPFADVALITLVSRITTMIALTAVAVSDVR